jgi:hypothetical protein
MFMVKMPYARSDRNEEFSNMEQRSKAKEALVAFRRHCRTDISRAAHDALRALEEAIEELERDRRIWIAAANGEAEIGKRLEALLLPAD